MLDDSNQITSRQISTGLRTIEGRCFFWNWHEIAPSKVLLWDATLAAIKPAQDGAGRSWALQSPCSVLVPETVSLLRLVRVVTLGVPVAR